MDLADFEAFISRIKLQGPGFATRNRGKYVAYLSGMRFLSMPVTCGRPITDPKGKHC